LAHRAYVSAASAGEHLQTLVREGSAVELTGARYTTPGRVQEARDAVIGVLNRFHDERPLVMGFPRKELLPAVARPRLLTEHALSGLLAEGSVVSTPHGLRIRERAPSLSGPKAAIAESVARICREAGFAAPRRDQIPPEVGAPAPIVEPIIDYLLQDGTLVALTDKVLLHRDIVETGRARLIDHLESHGAIEVGAFKDLIGSTRKYAVPLLEHFDREGLTRRVGDTRVLREHRDGKTGQAALS
jgi:selenocysteine-specific elongation factor